MVSILRAGDGLLQGMLDLVPSARVGHVGIYRDPESLTAVEYYFKVPEDLQERLVIVVDPMLATGNSAVAAVSRIKEEGAQQIKFVCLLAAPEGIAQFQSAHPDVPIFTAAIDQKPQRPRLHHPRPRRRRRPAVRDQVALSEPALWLAEQASRRRPRRRRLRARSALAM